MHLYSSHWWISIEEFHPGSFLQSDVHTIQDLQLGQAKHHCWSVDRIACHLKNKTKQNKKTNKCLVKQSGYQPLLRNINSGDEPSLLWGIWDKYDAMWLPVYLPCSQQLFQWPSWQQHIGPFPAEGTLYARLYTQPVQPQNCLFLQETSALMRLWVHANGCPLKKEETDFG